MAKGKTSVSSDAQSARPTVTDTEFTQALEFLSHWNSELMGFYARRFQQYGVLPLRLLTCASVSDLKALQHDFLQQLADDYRDEAAKLSQIAATPKLGTDASGTTNYAESLKKAQADATAILDAAKAQAERIVASAEEKACALTEAPEEQERKRA